jgi:WD40 repeat protein
MTDIETRLTRLLRSAADGVEAESNVEEVIRSALGQAHDAAREPAPRRRHTRRIVVPTLVAAATVLLIVGLFAVQRTRSTDTPAVMDVTPTVHPSAPTTAPGGIAPAGVDLPANGVIVRLYVDGPVFEIDPTTGVSRTTTDFDDLGWVARPTVSPDGTRIAYVRGGVVRVRDRATGVAHDVAPCRADGCTMAWSPDGSDLAISPRRGAITLVDPDDSMSQPVTEVIALNEQVAEVHVVDWTPDGERIVFVSLARSAAGSATAGDVVQSIETVRVDGTSRTTIVDVREPTSLGSVDVSPRDATIGWIEMDPRQASSLDDSPRETTDLTLHLMNLDGTEQRVIADLGTCHCVGFQPDFTWSPDGTQFAFSRLRQVGELMIADSSNPDRARSIGDGGGELVWLPAEE